MRVIRSTNSNNASVITDDEEDSIASRIRNKRKRNRNQTRRRILAKQWQHDEDEENNSISYWVTESTVGKESMKVEKIYNYHMYTLKPS